jgi:hypothetical protein
MAREGEDVELVLVELPDRATIGSEGCVGEYHDERKHDYILVIIRPALLIAISVEEAVLIVVTCTFCTDKHIEQNRDDW